MRFAVLLMLASLCIEVRAIHKKTIATLESITDAFFALDPHWKGALPATFLYDARGAKKQSWLGSVTYGDLRARVSGLLKRRKR